MSASDHVLVGLSIFVAGAVFILGIKSTMDEFDKREKEYEERKKRWFDGRK